jgi:hypothetical protein
MMKQFFAVLIIGVLLLSLILLSTLAANEIRKPTQTLTPQVVISTLYPPPRIATAYAQEPAAGICASFDGEMVVVNIYPDIPDPRCSKVRADQHLTIVNNTQNNVEALIGSSFEADLAPGEKTVIHYPFSDYLYPGVHQVQVTPCCGFELWLEDTK